MYINKYVLLVLNAGCFEDYENFTILSDRSRNLTVMKLTLDNIIALFLHIIRHVKPNSHSLLKNINYVEIRSYSIVCLKFSAFIKYVKNIVIYMIIYIMKFHFYSAFRYTELNRRRTKRRNQSRDVGIYKLNLNYVCLGS